MTIPIIGQVVTYITPDQIDNDADAEILNVRDENTVDLLIKFVEPDGRISTAHSFFCIRGEKAGQWKEKV